MTKNASSVANLKPYTGIIFTMGMPTENYLKNMVVGVISVDTITTYQMRVSTLTNKWMTG